MKEKNKLFLRTTEKLYKIVQEMKERKLIKGKAHPSILDVQIEKSEFEDDEWNFLKTNENNFSHCVDINLTKTVCFPIYEIEGKVLKTNEINLTGIQNKYYQK